MELFNHFKKGLNLCTISMLMVLSSCDNEYDSLSHEPQTQPDSEPYKEIIQLQDGTEIVITDSVVYNIDTTQLIAFNDSQENNLSNATNLPINKVGVAEQMVTYGFDSKKAQSDYKKCTFAAAEDYGLSRTTIYIARPEYVYKKLPCAKNAFVSPINNIYHASEKDMGWKISSNVFGELGFAAESTSDPYTYNGITQIMFVNCDISGIVYNQSLPAEPQNFKWNYFMFDVSGE